jgi:hypothetical protein
MRVMNMTTRIVVRRRLHSIPTLLMMGTIQTLSRSDLDEITRYLTRDTYERDTILLEILTPNRTMKVEVYLNDLLFA